MGSEGMKAMDRQKVSWGLRGCERGNGLVYRFNNSIVLLSFISYVLLLCENKD
jgi:hypothetical protein